MRNRTYAFFAVAGMAAVLGACSGQVLVDGKSGTTSGATGAGGAPATSSASVGPTATGTSASTTTDNSSSSVTTSGGGGAGGMSGNPCADACAHAKMCGTDICSMIPGGGANCMNPAQACAAMCVSALPCAQLNLQSAIGCYQSCMMGGPTSSSATSSSVSSTSSVGSTSSVSSTGSGPVDAGMPDASGSGAACNQCVTGNNCKAEIAACGKDFFGCGPWLFCSNQCNMANPVDPQCSFACDMKHAGASKLYKPVYACACAKCGVECGTGDPCAHM